MITRFARWWRARRTTRVDDPFADAMQLRGRQAIRRTLAQVRAENARRAGL
jgi:hypothetical protein